MHWAGGQLNYYVDQGPLSATVSNQQATAMVDAAAAIWSAVPTAGVTLTDEGPLNEDVNGLNISAVKAIITAPADVTPSAINYPLAVIYDANGSVINAIFGDGSSEPDTCQNNAVFVWHDTINPDATIAHAVIVLNGQCATTPALVAMMSFELERAFGRVLGLDYSQVNPTALTDTLPGGTQGWPVMQPLSGTCTAVGGECIPDPGIAPLRRHRIAQPYLPNHRRKPLQFSRQTNHRGQHRSAYRAPSPSAAATACKASMWSPARLIRMETRSINTR